MPRAIWTGTISFGLVTVPVKLYAAVQPKTVRFNQLDSTDHSRIAMKRTNAQTGEEVPYERIVKGYEVAPDRYVVIEPDELAALDPRKTKTIDIEGFVDLAEVDPIYFDHPYYLVPGTGGAKPYRLLVDAMRETNRAAIARVVIRSKEQMVALRAMGEVLTMNTMVFHDEVVDAEQLDEVPAAEDVEARPAELKMATQLVDSLAEPWEPEKYTDSYREQVMDLIERKAAGEEIAVQPAAEQASPVPDLMAALKASLDNVRGVAGGGGDDEDDAEAKPKPKRKPAARKAPAKAPAKKRASAKGE